MWSPPCGTRAIIVLSAKLRICQFPSSSIEITLEMVSLEGMNVQTLSDWSQSTEDVGECGAYHTAQER
jgi:hypothetical protein